MELGGIRSPICPNTSSFELQNPKKLRRKTKGRKEIEAVGGSRRRVAVRPRQHSRATPATGRGGNHGLPVVVCGPTVPPFLERCVLMLLFGLRVLPCIFLLGLSGPLLQSSLIHFASTSSFNPITWLHMCKSKIKNPE